MSRLDGELRFRMIERRNGFPSLRARVTTLACEFRLMRIGVARIARMCGEAVVAKRCARRLRLVTRIAGHGCMRPNQRKARLRMPGDRERRWMKA